GVPRVLRVARDALAEGLVRRGEARSEGRLLLLAEVVGSAARGRSAPRQRGDRRRQRGGRDQGENSDAHRSTYLLGGCPDVRKEVPGQGLGEVRRSAPPGKTAVSLQQPSGFATMPAGSA